MRIKVPKLIDIEDKTIGPLTIKQFGYLAGGGGVLFICWFVLTLGAFIIAAIPIISACAFLAFYKFNDQPLLSVIGSLTAYLMKPKLYLWRKTNGK